MISFWLQEKLAKFKKYNAHSAHVTNVRWVHDDSCVVTVGGADLAMIVWNNLDEGTARTVVGGVDESDGDTDSEEESGYDSDVDREKKIDYTTKTYTSSLRETSGTKPQLQAKEESRKYACLTSIVVFFSNLSYCLGLASYSRLCSKIYKPNRALMGPRAHDVIWLFIYANC